MPPPKLTTSERRVTPRRSISSQMRVTASKVLLSSPSGMVMRWEAGMSDAVFLSATHTVR